MTTGSVQEIQAARTRVEAAISRPNAWSRSKDPPLKDSPARMPPTPSNSATLPRAFPRRGRPLQRFDEGLMLNSSHTPRRSPRSLRKRERQTPRGGAARGTGLLGPSDAGDPQPYAAGSTVAGCRGHPRLCHAAASDAYRRGRRVRASRRLMRSPAYAKAGFGTSAGVRKPGGRDGVSDL
jgi:hypothetical protein